VSDLLFKVIKGNESCFGGKHVWDLPTDAGPGAWQPEIRKVAMSERGYHVTREPAHYFFNPTYSVYVAEIRGKSATWEYPAMESQGTDPTAIVAAECRLLRLATPEELTKARILSDGEHGASSGFYRVHGTAKLTAFDSACAKASGSSRVESFGYGEVYVSDTASVFATGRTHVQASDESVIVLTGGATARAIDSVTVDANGPAVHVVATGKAKVRARFAQVTLHNKATVFATGAARIAAYGSSAVEAHDTAVVEAYESCSVVARGWVAVIRRSPHATVTLHDNAVEVDRTSGKPIPIVGSLSQGVQS